jgi:outer membrane protein OmpA-like peptidoglycan-associated protein
MWLLVGLPQVLAQDVEVPEMNSQRYRTSIDAEQTLWTDDAGQAESNTGRGALVFGYMNRPFVYEGDDGTSTALVQDALQANLLGGYQLGPVRIGADVPLYILTTSDVAAGGGGLGDLAVDLKGTVLNREDYPLGLALGARFGFPTSTVDAPLGSSGVDWEIEGIVDRKVNDWLLAANIGTRGLPETTLENVEINDQFFYRLGAGYAITDAAGVSGDLVGELSYADPISNPAGTPIELLAGGWGHLTDMVTLKGGLGTGMSRGIGSPTFRGVLALQVAPAANRDADLDGVVDSVDECPKEMEDVDQYKDDDGCPDPSYAVHVVVQDHNGKVVPGAVVTLSGEGGPASGGSDFTPSLHPGSYTLNATASGFHSGTSELTLSATGPAEHVIVLDRITGKLHLMVKDTAGKPIPSAKYRVLGEQNPGVTDATGTATSDVSLGDHTVAVTADGYRTTDQTFAIAEAKTTEVTVTLAPTKVKVTTKKIEILDKVYFDTAKASIKPESFPLLDEVARVLLDNPQILKVRIEGHTDSRVNDASNMKLSQSRAQSVEAYLISKGVEPARLMNQGFGETQPVDKRNVSAAWDKNRRVEFVIIDQKAE